MTTTTATIHAGAAARRRGKLAAHRYEAAVASWLNDVRPRPDRPAPSGRRTRARRAGAGTPAPGARRAGGCAGTARGRR